MNQPTVKSRNWVMAPTKKILVLFTTGWLISTALLVLAITDLFNEPFFQGKYTVMYILMLSSTLTILRLYLNYFKQKQLRQPVKS